MIIKVTPDKEKAKSMIGLIKDREQFVSSVNTDQFSTIATENYYEIIKELATALLLLDGLKAIGEYAHKDLIDYLSKYKEFSEEDIVIMDDLRIKRNKSSYEGKRIDKSYLQNQKLKLMSVIERLKKLVSSKF